MLLTFTMSILLGILTFILIIVSVLLVLLVLMQKSKSDGGVGAALGGGMTESAFGADTNNVLSKTTINATIVFFDQISGALRNRLSKGQSNGHG